MGAVVEIWFESLIPFLLKDSHIVHCWAVHFKRGRHSLGHGFDLLVQIFIYMVYLFVFWKHTSVFMMADGIGWALMALGERAVAGPTTAPPTFLLALSNGAARS